MDLDAFDYPLPKELIAYHPVSPRDHARLFVLDRKQGTRDHMVFHQIGEKLRAGDLLVLNNTRVFPARLFGECPHGKIEALLLEKVDAETLSWRCLIKPARKVAPGLRLAFAEGASARIYRHEDDGFVLHFEGISEKDFPGWLERSGSTPLPPYIKRKAEAEDRSTYQTVFAKNTGSVAAPTAGLHFTESLLSALRAQGVLIRELTLHVGYGTFSPIRANCLDDHKMHEEYYEIPQTLADEITEAKSQKRRIIAVGTTSLRALESWPSLGKLGRTSLFIRPGYRFQVADGLVTNFHVPKSSLFILISALIGVDEAKKAYEEAIALRYRFFSYGDAMLILS